MSGPVTLGSAAEPTNDADSDPTNPAGESTDNRSNRTVDFGFYRLVVGDKVWIDANNDGIRQGTEALVAGASVQLLDGSGTVVATATTDAIGNYLFDRLANGAPLSPGTTYRVRVPGGQTALAGLVPATPNISGTNDQNNGVPSGSDAVSQTFQLTPGVANTTQTVDTATGTTANPTLDFGFRSLGASLGNQVWRDTDENGQQDAGEPGVSGVKVSLVDAGGNPVTDIYGNAVASQTTDTDGKYLFTYLPAGTYQVIFDSTTLPANTEFTTQFTGAAATDSDANRTSGKSGFTTLGANETNLSVDAGIIAKRASIGNFVWSDTDGDGVQDAGEPGVPGVTVRLLDGTGNVLATKVTDSAGAYLFDRLKPDVAYTVEFAPASLPTGYQFTLTTGLDPATNSDANVTTGRAAPVTPTPGQNITAVDAGITPKPGASLGDLVWNDANADGQKDTGELGIPGVKVSLVDATTGNAVQDLFGNPVAQQTTDAAGRYLFTNLSPGSYRVVFDRSTLPAGTQLTTQDTGADESDSDANPTTGQTGSYTPTAGEDNLTVDAGVRATPASLGDTVWYDTNRNNQQDSGETGVPNITVKLLDSSGAAVRTTTTDTDGKYRFDNLPPNVTYTVEFVSSTLPSGYRFTAANVGGDATDSDADPVTGKTGGYALAPGENNVSADAGIHLIPASLGDRVWYDTDRNGKQDPGEDGVRGVTVRLLNTAGVEVATTTTDTNGRYQFDNLTPNVAYTVEFVASTLPVDHGFTTQGASDGTANSDADPTTGKTGTYILSPGENNPNVDAGIVKITASIGDRVFIDANKNGALDASETGVPGVKVNLLDTTGAVIATATTDTDGNYLFADLPPNVAYSVQFDPASLPAGYVFTTPNIGLDAGDSDADPTTGKTGSYTPGNAEEILTVDAGLVLKPASLGDYVWFDLNKNGQQDAGEKGVPGVTVELLDGTGNVVATAVTSADGAYRFGVEANTPYSVRFVRSTLPEGFVFTTKDTGDDATDSDADPITGTTGTYSLAPGTHDPTIDAGIAPEPGAALGNAVWLDTNRNGQQDPGEPGVAGVKVTITDANGNPVIDIFGNPVPVQVTDAQGAYLFTKLRPGTYKVTFDPTTLPAQSVFTKKDTGADATDSDADPTTGATGSYVLAKDEVNLTVDAGIVTKPASLGDFVWFDDNANGIQDPGEKPVSGVRVNLLDASGALAATAVTDGNGAYRFENLVPGNTYVVEFVAATLPSGFVFTAPGAGTDDNNSDASQTSGRTRAITLAPGEHNPRLDAGIAKAPSQPVAVVPETTITPPTIPVPTTSVAPTTTVPVAPNTPTTKPPTPTVPKPQNALRVLVFADKNGDGTSNGDSGIGTAIIELVAPDGTVRQVPVSANGEIALTDIPAGRYKIRVVTAGVGGKATTKVLGEVVVPEAGEGRIEFGYTPDEPPATQLAFTGSATTSLSVLALAIVALGVALVMIGRRRRSEPLER